VAKLQALAARQVARELALAHVWSWGWGVFNEAGRDADKAGAACVWLWTRDPKLCDAPGRYRFDTDLRAGQIDLPPRVRCAYEAHVVTTNEIGELARVTGDAELALATLYARLVERGEVPVSTAEVLAVERAVVSTRFGGSRSAYLAALGRARASLSVARALLADELRRRKLSARLRVRTPSVSQLAEFQQTHGALLAREVEVSPAPSWLPSGRGLALATDAPAGLFRLAEGAPASLRTLGGVLSVRPLGETTPLAAVPFATARAAIARVLREAARSEAYHTWTLRRQEAGLAKLRCVRDRLPAVGAAELTTYLPFLALRES
jgi:hypothetical protein